MKKSKKKSSKPSGSKNAKALKEVKDMIADLKEAGMIFSDVARHFHHRVRHATRVLSGGHKTQSKGHKKKKTHKKKRR